jgi:formamidopyrimidine-DNA glycosylase
MPELPEVESFRRASMRVVDGATLEKVWVADDPIVFEKLSPRKVQSRLKGRTVVGSGRRGKQFWLELDDRPWPVFHFGMTGRAFEVGVDDERPRFAKLDLITNAGRRLVVVNARRLGRVRFRDDPPLEPPIDKLGFDPLTEMPTAGDLAALFAKRKLPIKALLLDQKIAAGVGNWIADEVLFQAKIAPHRPAKELTLAEVKKLRSTLLKVIGKAVDVEADADRFPRSWLFHVRWGKQEGATTSKGDPLQFDTVGGRTTAWVPSVQR